jgi:hypothetical protein
MDQYFLYRHIRLDTNKPFYVGIGKKPKSYNGYRTEYKRAFNTSHRNVYWKNVVAKTEYKVEIIMESDNVDFIKEKEVEFISLYKRKEDGGTLTNLTSGGEFNQQEVYQYRKNFKHSEETKKVISEKSKGRKPTEETKQLLSEMRKDLHFHKHLLDNQELLEKARKNRRDGLPKVYDKITKVTFNSLPDACEVLNLNLKNERKKLYRKSEKCRLVYVNPEILLRYKRNKP